MLANLLVTDHGHHASSYTFVYIYTNIYNFKRNRGAGNSVPALKLSWGLWKPLIAPRRDSNEETPEPVPPQEEQESE